MAKKVKITKGGQTVYPATVMDAVVHKDLRVDSSKLIEEVNVSKIFPTGGIDGTNKYTLETAIAMIPASLRSVGIKCSFINAGGVLESWEWQGGTFTSTASWIAVGGKEFEGLEKQNGIQLLGLNSCFIKGENIPVQKTKVGYPNYPQKKFYEIANYSTNIYDVSLLDYIYIKFNMTHLKNSIEQFAIVFSNDEDFSTFSILYGYPVVKGVLCVKVPEGNKYLAVVNTYDSYIVSKVLTSIYSNRAAVSPINDAPYLGFNDQTEGIRTITESGLKNEEDVLTDNFTETEVGRFYSAQTAVTFTNIQGLKQINLYIGTGLVKSILPAEIELFSEKTIYWNGTKDDGSVNVCQFRVLTEGDDINVSFSYRYIVVYDRYVASERIIKAESNNFILYPDDLEAYKSELSGFSSISDISKVLKKYPFDQSIDLDVIDYKNWDKKEYNISVDDLGVISNSDSSEGRIYSPVIDSMSVNDDFIIFANCNISKGRIRIHTSNQLIEEVAITKIVLQKFTAKDPNKQLFLLFQESEFSFSYFFVFKYSEGLYNYLSEYSKYIKPTPYSLPYIASSHSESDEIVESVFSRISLDIYYDAVNTDMAEPVRGKEWKSVAADSFMEVSKESNLVTVDFEMKALGSDYNRAYYGFNTDENTPDNRLVVITTGYVVATNCKSVGLWSGTKSQDEILLAQDLEDNLEVQVKGMKNLYEVEGDTYAAWHAKKKSNAEGATYKFKITRFFVCKEIDGFSVDDYIELYDGGNLEFRLKKLPDSAATKEYVDNGIQELRSELSDSGSVGNEYSIKYEADVNMLINYGQSLSVGGSQNRNSANYYKTLTFKGGGNEWASNVDIDNPESVNAFYGTDLLIFEEQTSGIGAAVGSNALAWMNTLIKENNLDLNTFDYQFLCSTPGYSGASIGAFIKNPTVEGANYYKRLLFSVRKGKELANKVGKTFAVPAVFWVQGEADSGSDNEYGYGTEEAYAAALKQLASDLNNDIKNITGQPGDVAFITYQMASYLSVGRPSSATWAQINLALQAQQDRDEGIPNNIYYGSTMYQWDYGTDLYHPLDRNIIGLQAGINAKKIVNDKKAPRIFYMKKHWVQEDAINSQWLLNIEFDVPNPPMRFHYPEDGYHNVNGKQPNYGFELKNVDGQSIIAEEPVIKRGNTLIIRCSENPIGAQLSYALSGHYGGGNLCDSQNFKITIDNKEYVVDNFLPTFKDYEIVE